MNSSVVLIRVLSVDRSRTVHRVRVFLTTEILKMYLKQVKPLKLTAQAYRNPFRIVERATSRIRRSPKTDTIPLFPGIGALIET